MEDGLSIRESEFPNIAIYDIEVWVYATYDKRAVDESVDYDVYRRVVE